MRNIPKLAILELNRNVLRIVSPSLSAKSLNFDETEVSDTKILAYDSFLLKTRDLIKSLNEKVTGVVFLIEEKDIYDRFFVVRNDDENQTTDLKAQASAFVGGSLDDLYCVYQKVSPFIYQFIGVKKELVDIYVKLGGSLGYNLSAVIPTSFVLARFVGTLDPFFLTLSTAKESSLVASEYGGVYFSGTYAKGAEANKKMVDLITELAVFNRENPINTIYYVGNEVKVAGNFTVNKLEVPGVSSPEGYEGFEKLLIASSLVYKDGFLDSYFNLLNFTKDEILERKPKALVKYIPASLVAVSLILGIFLVYLGVKLPRNPVEAPQVMGTEEATTTPLPKSDEKAKEATVSEAPKTTPTDPKVTAVKIRVENGGGIQGSAGKAKDFLTGLGYNVTQIGNAVSFDYLVTEIHYKKSVSDISKLKEALSKNYSTKDFNDLKESEGYDVLVIVGQK